jgi:hypothetical protein
MGVEVDVDQITSRYDVLVVICRRKSYVGSAPTSKVCVDCDLSDVLGDVQSLTAMMFPTVMRINQNSRSCSA